MSAPTVLQIAQQYVAEHWCIVPIPYRSKNPNRRGWQRLRLDSAGVLREFGGPDVRNVGVHLGEASNGLIDTDLDAPEAVALAPVFLPETPRRFGRTSKRDSHWLYLCDSPVKTIKFVDPTQDEADHARSMLLEVRSSGCQTLFPGSVHPEGEVIEWTANASHGSPAQVSGDALVAAAGRLAAASLLVRCWNAGARHELVLPLAGTLARGNWSADDVVEFVLPILKRAGDNEIADRERAIRDTCQKLADGKPVTGFPTLAQVIDARAVRKLVDWLGLHADVVQASATQYEARANGLYWIKSHDESRQLTNFTARTIGSVVRDDGVLVAREVEVEGALGHRTARTSVPVAQFAGLNWTIDLLGPGATVMAGMGFKDHARAAIQLLSGDVPERRVYGHSGWRVIDGLRVYLHAGGAIGPGGAVSGIEVELPERLGLLRLPEVPPAERLCEAVKASVNMLVVAPHNVVMPLFAAIWRAPLEEATLAVHLEGRTGTRKSTLAALAQAHYGVQFDALHLPAAWVGTANALETMAFIAKDALLVIDDYVARGTPIDVQRAQAKMDQVLRGMANQGGRSRLSADTRLRGQRWGRGLVLSTGEDLVQGESLQGRVLHVHVTQDDVDLQRLTEAQQHARDGLYAESMAGYLRHLAISVNFERAQKTLAEYVVRYRADPQLAAAHPQIVKGCADLAGALHVFGLFAEAVGALTEKQAVRLDEIAADALRDVALSQPGTWGREDLARRFLRTLGSALGTTRAHVANTRGAPPLGVEAASPEDTADLSAYGWRVIRGDLQPQGDCIGWLDDNCSDLYLDMSTALDVVQKLTARSTSPFVATETTLRRRLKEAGLLVSTGADTGRESLSVRRVIGGVRREVLHVQFTSLYA